MPYYNGRDYDIEDLSTHTIAVPTHIPMPWKVPNIPLPKGGQDVPILSGFLIEPHHLVPVANWKDYEDELMSLRRGLENQGFNVEVWKPPSGVSKRPPFIKEGMTKLRVLGSTEAEIESAIENTEYWRDLGKTVPFKQTKLGFEEVLVVQREDDSEVLTGAAWFARRGERAVPRPGEDTLAVTVNDALVQNGFNVTQDSRGAIYVDSGGNTVTPGTIVAVLGDYERTLSQQKSSIGADAEAYQIAAIKAAEAARLADVVAAAFTPPSGLFSPRGADPATYSPRSGPFSSVTISSGTLSLEISTDPARNDPVQDSAYWASVIKGVGGGTRIAPPDGSAGNMVVCRGDSAYLHSVVMAIVNRYDAVTAQSLKTDIAQGRAF